jgi:hypothetical protein
MEIMTFTSQEVSMYISPKPKRTYRIWFSKPRKESLKEQNNLKK